MPYGYNGKILRVDLSKQTTLIETPPEIFYRRYMGGRAIALYYLLKEQKPGIDPYASESMLIFAASVITGAPAPSIPRYTVAGKSPMTGGFGESEAGGHWGPELKKAGFDAIIITGKAVKPVYLYIHDGVVEFKDAGHIWGKDILDVEGRIKRELNEPRARVASIGIAGENMVRYACILNDISANGRNGFGAVMGSKNLKAIAVRGTGQVTLADPDTVKEITKWVAVNYKSNPLSYNLNEYGTASAIAGLQASGMLPTRNFTSGVFEGYKSIDGDTFHRKYVGKKTCYSCPIACKKKATVEDERFTVDPEYGSPEYETVGAFGSNMALADANVVLKANELCNRYGLDTISTGVTISFAMECFEKGILSKEQTAGVDLRYGNAEAMLQTIELIARKEGIGKLLAEGSKRAAEIIGKDSIKYAVQAKGLELPMHDPRAKYTVGIGYAVAAAGPDHMSMPHDTFYETTESITSRGFDQLTFYEPIELLTKDERKAKMAAYGQFLWSAFNVLGVCVFGVQPRGIIPLDGLVRLVKAITGFNTNLFDLLEVGRRSINMARVFNFREGFTREDDKLPARAFEPVEEGRLQGAIITEKELNASLREYYSLMGWDQETGYPLPATLRALDLEWAT